MEVRQGTVFMHCNSVAKTIFAETLGSRYVFLPTYRFRRDPESFVIEPMRNLREVMGYLEIVRPATDDCRSTFKSNRDAFLRWALTKDFAQSRPDVGDCLAAYPEFGHEITRFANTN